MIRVIQEGQQSLTPHNFQGNEDDDAQAGIPHLKMHQGILQSISFEKTDIPGYREARMEQMMIQNQWNPYIQLTNVYNVALETVGNTIITELEEEIRHRLTETRMAVNNGGLSKCLLRAKMI